RLEVHVRHPERQDIGAVLLPLGAVGVPAVDETIEVVGHGGLKFYFPAVWAGGGPRAPRGGGPPRPGAPVTAAGQPPPPRGVGPRRTRRAYEWRDSMAMRIGIIGAGAIGSVVGGMLTKAGHDVTLIDQWPAHVETMRKNGLRLSGTCGDHVIPVKALHIYEA